MENYNPSEHRTFELLKANKKVLELMAKNRSLDDILCSIVNLIETFASGCMSTVYFVVDGKLTLGAAPSWPLDFVKVVDGCPIGFNQGTCGHAAFTGKRSISTDVTKDEVWGPFRDWILSYGIKAAWSTPVISEDDGRVIATVSMCWKEPRVPTEWDFEIVDAAVKLMQVAVERKRHEDLISEQSIKLMNSSRLVALGEMAANLAHEINNPLSIIRGHASLLQLMCNNQKVNPQDIQKSAKDIEKTVLRIAGIVKGLKAISKDGENDPFEIVDGRSLVEETLSFCHERFKQNNVELIVTSTEGALMLECRPVQISQALLNLLNNAFDAVNGLQEKWINLNMQLKGNECILSVTDSGNGIPKDVQKNIMTPFFSTKKQNNGTGLGLSISRKIIEKHNGTLTIDQDCPNTKFNIQLPLKQQL